MLRDRAWECGGMVDATDLKSVGCNGRASSSLATPIIVETSKHTEGNRGCDYPLSCYYNGSYCG
jgi:hypothetical protein